VVSTAKVGMNQCKPVLLQLAIIIQACAAKKAKQIYKPLGAIKACDYCKIIDSIMASNFMVTLCIKLYYWDETIF
jgi:hypothetical protein